MCYLGRLKKGQLLTSDGVRNVTLSTGSDGTFLMADSLADEGFSYQAISIPVLDVVGTPNRVSVSGTTTKTIDIAATYIGQMSITTLGTVTSGTWNATVVTMQYGGTGANLTPSNGGILYSGATALAILAGVAAANRVLLSGNSAAPTWSNATYPSSTTANQILYSSANNSITGLATVNNGVLATNNSGVPGFVAAGTVGQVLTAQTAAPPIWTTPTDYQEGTWTPTLLGSTTNPTVTYSQQTGRYTKIGRQVMLQCVVRSSAQSGGSGDLVIGGLPFTSANVTNLFSVGVLSPGIFAISNDLVGCGDIFINLAPNSVTATPTYYNNTTDVNNPFTTGSVKNITFTLTYTV